MLINRHHVVKKGADLDGPRGRLLKMVTKQCFLWLNLNRPFCFYPNCNVKQHEDFFRFQRNHLSTHSQFSFCRVSIKISSYPKSL